MPERFDRPGRSPSQKPTRIFLSTDKDAIAPDELNQLFTRAGLPIRDLAKLAVALQHSPFCVAARSFRDKTLVGFIRATSDGVFNTTVWDLAVDRSLANQTATKSLLITRLKREVKKVIPACAISVFADPCDYDVLRQANFAEDSKGIQAMALPQDDASRSGYRP